METVNLQDRNQNNVLQLRPIPDEILRFRISGYNVVKTWLKFHSWPYTRADFDKPDLEQFCILIFKIKEQIRLINDIDEEVRKIMSGELQLLACD